MEHVLWNRTQVKMENMKTLGPFDIQDGKLLEKQMLLVRSYKME